MTYTPTFRADVVREEEMQQTVLLVDDDHQTLFFMEQILRSSGLGILTAEDGSQAVRILQTHIPTLIFLDILLPRVNGLDVLAFIQDTPALDNTYVVVMTAHNRSHFADSPQVDRVNLYLVKPVRPREIRQITEQVIAGRH